MKSKKLLSVLLAVIFIFSSCFIGVSASASTEIIEEVIISKTQLSVEESTWILEAVSQGYLLKNKATGLYLTMDKTNSTLFQAPKRSAVESQRFAFLTNGNHRIMYNNAYNLAIYSNTDGNAVLFQSASNWWTAPEGAANNAYCQFQATIADGEEIVIRFAGGGAYLQAQIIEDVIVSKTQLSVEESTWILHKVSDKYRLENKATGLYLTMEHDGTNFNLFQAYDRGNANTSQLFAFTKTSGSVGNGYYFLKHVTLNRTIYSNDDGNEILTRSAGDWTNPPPGASANSLCQFHSTLDFANADGAELVIKMAGGGAYLQAQIIEDVIMSKTLLSEEQATWKLEAVSQGYLLKNKATGLYLTMDQTNSTLFQAPKRSVVESQRFAFFTNSAHRIMYNNAYNAAVYSNTDGNAILFQSASNWWTAPEGAASNSYCQFQANIADGEEIVIRFAGGGAYLQSAISPVKTEEKVTVTAGAEANGTVSGNAGEVVVGTSITLNATADAGYVFDGWYFGEIRVSADAEYTFVAEQDINLVAKFVAFYGDADFNGEIGNADAVVIRKELMNEAEYKAQYDANEDGKFDILDLVKIKDLLLDKAE